MVRLFVVGLVVLAGCDTVFGLTRDDDAPEDARISDALDAPNDGALSQPCAARGAPPEFCFDFDDPTFVGYQRGNSFPIVPSQNGIVIDRRPPAFTAPNALWFDAVNAGVAVVAKTDDTVAFHRIAASLRIRGTSVAATRQSMSVFTMSVDSASQCRGELSADAVSLEMTYTIGCGNDTISTPAGTLTDAWQHVSISFDRATGAGTISVGTAVSSQLQIFGGPGTDAPTITFGMISAMEPGIRIAFDDITVVGE